MSPFTPRDTVSSPPAGVELNALPPGHVLRSTLRICAGLLVVILGMLACTLALFTAVTPDRFTFVTWLVSIFLLLAGFAGLAVTRVPWAPLRPTRIALAVSVIIAASCFRCRRIRSAHLGWVPWPRSWSASRCRFVPRSGRRDRRGSPSSCSVSLPPTACSRWDTTGWGSPCMAEVGASIRRCRPR